MSSPILIPGQRLDLGQAISGAFKVYKRGFGAFVSAILMPMAAALVLSLIGFIILIAGIASNPFGNPVGPIVAFLVFYVLAMVVGGLLGLKGYGMVIQGTFDIVQGHRPSFGDLWARTQGVIGRMLVVFLLLMAAALVISIGMGLLTVIPMLGAFRTGEMDSASGVAASAWVNLLSIVVQIAFLFLAVKLMFLLPEVTVQKVDGITGAKRSWSLTNNSFWRLLGYTLVMGLLVGAIMSVFYFVGAMIMFVGALGSFSTMFEGGDPGAGIGGVIAAFVIGFIIMFGGVFVLSPLGTIFSSLLYAERINEGPDTGQAWTSHPGQGPAPAAQWGGQQPQAGQWNGQQQPPPGQWGGQQPQAGQWGGQQPQAGQWNGQQQPPPGQWSGQQPQGPGQSSSQNFPQYGQAGSQGAGQWQPQDPPSGGGGGGQSPWSGGH